MKIIDLLNKIANGEELPNKIRFNNTEWNKVYGEKNVCYLDEYDSDFFLYFFRNNLDFTLNDEVEIIEEEKKIPEKLDVISWDKCIHGVTHKEKELAIEINKTQELLNQVIDYLKSKGE